MNPTKMEAKEINTLLKQLAKGEKIADPKKARFIQQKLMQDAELRTLLGDYKEAFKNNELHLLERKKSFKQIENQALIAALKRGESTPEMHNRAAAKLVTDQAFRARYQQEFPQETTEKEPETEKKVIPLQKILKYSLRIAAALTLLITAWWFTGQALVYNEALTAYEQFEQRQASIEEGSIVPLGIEKEISGTVCTILDQFEQAAKNKDFIYVPEGGVRVVETGSKFGVKFFVVQENECEITVLVKTDAALPSIGERISFDARAFEVSALGMSLKVLVEEQRHVVY